MLQSLKNNLFVNLTNCCEKNWMWHLESLRKIAIVEAGSVYVWGDAVDISLSNLISVWLGLNHREKLRVYKFELPGTFLSNLSDQLETKSPLLSFKRKQIQSWRCCRLRERKLLAVSQWLWKWVQLSHAVTGFKSLSSDKTFFWHFFQQFR